MSQSDLSNSTAATSALSAPPFDDGKCRRLVGQSTAWIEAFRMAEVAGRNSCSTLILGEVGSGKRTLAQLIHQCSRLADRCCWVLRAGTEDERVLSRILTSISPSAVAQRWNGSAGFIEFDDLGTLLIEDVDLLSAPAQAQLLEILILSDSALLRSALPERPLPFIVATSQQDIRELVIDRQFREDLFWRLSIFLIELAPLRRRVDDIEPLIQHFLSIFAERYSREEMTVDPSAREVLIQYSWPGNIIELKNYLQRAVAGSETNALTLAMFPTPISGDLKSVQQAVFRPTDPLSLIREYVNSQMGKVDDIAIDLHKQIVEPVEKELIQQVMELCNQTQTKAASRLGINRNTLYKKLVEYGLNKALESVEDRD